MSVSVFARGVNGVGVGDVSVDGGGGGGGPNPLVLYVLLLPWLWCWWYWWHGWRCWCCWCFVVVVFLVGSRTPSCCVLCRLLLRLLLGWRCWRRSCCFVFVAVGVFVVVAVATAAFVVVVVAVLSPNGWASVKLKLTFTSTYIYIYVLCVSLTRLHCATVLPCGKWRFFSRVQVDAGDVAEVLHGRQGPRRRAYAPHGNVLGDDAQQGPRRQEGRSADGQRCGAPPGTRGVVLYVVARPYRHTHKKGGFQPTCRHARSYSNRSV